MPNSYSYYDFKEASLKDFSYGMGMDTGTCVFCRESNVGLYMTVLSVAAVVTTALQSVMRSQVDHGASILRRFFFEYMEGS